MAVRITVMILRLSVLVALVLGILKWVGVLGSSIINIHMLFGSLVVCSLWGLGYFILRAPKGASLGLGIGAFVLGFVILIVGASQVSFPPPLAVQIIHLLLGLSGAGLGEAIAGRYKRLNATNA